MRFFFLDTENVRPSEFPHGITLVYCMVYGTMDKSSVRHLALLRLLFHIRQKILQMRNVIFFLNTENVRPSEFPRRITLMYCTVQGTMDKLFVRQLARNFKEGRGFLRKFKLKIFDQPPYIPDLALSDYHFFNKFKNFWSKDLF